MDFISFVNMIDIITGALKLADKRMYEDKEKFYKLHPELKR